MNPPAENGRGGWRGWFRLRPARASWTEAALMRLFFAGVLALSFSMMAEKARGFSGLPAPNGLGRWLDVAVLADPTVNSLAAALFLALLPLYVAGLALPLVGGLILLLHVALGSLLNSQGAIGHTYQPVSLVLGVQWLASLWAGIRRPSEWLFVRRAGGAAAVDASRQMLAACYAVSGLSKLVASGGLWMWNAPLLALQIEKTRAMNFYNTLEPVPGRSAEVAQLLLDHPWVARVLIGAALPLELLAVLACLNRGLGLVLGLVLILFHSTVSRIMGLDFSLNQYLLLIFFVNVPFWAWWALQSLRSSRGSAPPAGGLRQA